MFRIITSTSTHLSAIIESENDGETTQEEIGYMNLELMEFDSHEELYILDDIEVQPGHQGQGVGTELIRYAVEIYGSSFKIVNEIWENGDSDSRALLTPAIRLVRSCFNAGIISIANLCSFDENARQAIQISSTPTDSRETSIFSQAMEIDIPTISEAIEAVFKREFDTVHVYLDEGGDPNATDENDRTLLSAFFCEENLFCGYPEDLVLKIIEAGADLKTLIRLGDADFRYSDSASLLHAAYFGHSIEGTNNVIIRLLNHPDIDINLRIDVPSSAYARELFEDRDFNALNQCLGACYLENATLLHFAAAQGKTEVVKAILETGRADINAIANWVLNKDVYDDEHCYYVGKAFKGKYLDPVACYDDDYYYDNDAGEYRPISREHFRPSLDDDKRTFGHLAESMLDTFRDMVTVYRYGGVTPLHLAARGGFEDIITLLLKYGADKSLQDSDGNSAKEYLKSAMTQSENFKSIRYYEGYKGLEHTLFFKSKSHARNRILEMLDVDASRAMDVTFGR